MGFLSPRWKITEEAGTGDNEDLDKVYSHDAFFYAPHLSTYTEKKLMCVFGTLAQVLLHLPIVCTHNDNGTACIANATISLSSKIPGKR